MKINRTSDDVNINNLRQITYGNGLRISWHRLQLRARRKRARNDSSRRWPRSLGALIGLSHPGVIYGVDRRWDIYDASATRKSTPTSRRLGRKNRFELLHEGRRHPVFSFRSLTFAYMPFTRLLLHFTLSSLSILRVKHQNKEREKKSFSSSSSAASSAA